jgi:hypothetical protein
MWEPQTQKIERTRSPSQLISHLLPRTLATHNGHSVAFDILPLHLKPMLATIGFHHAPILAFLVEEVSKVRRPRVFVELDHGAIWMPRESLLIKAIEQPAISQTTINKFKITLNQGIRHLLKR